MVAEDALPYILRTRSFFNEEHVTQAEKLVDKKLLGLDKLSTLFDVICSETKTPQEWSCTVADGLGPFSMLVSLKRQILDKAQYAAPRDESRPVTYAPRKREHHNPSQFSSGQMPDSLTSRCRKRLRQEVLDAMAEDDQPAHQQPSSPPEIEVSEEIPDEIPDP